LLICAVRIGGQGAPWERSTMNHFSTVAPLIVAATNSKSSSSNYSFLLILIVIAAAGYFIFLRPQQQKAKRARAEAQKFEVGDEVITIGGVIGTVTHVHGNRVTLVTGHDERGPDGFVGQTHQMHVLRTAIARRVDPAELHGPDQPDQDDDQQDYGEDALELGDHRSESDAGEEGQEDDTGPSTNGSGGSGDHEGGEPKGGQSGGRGA
jgi:preprotein translocase subunit YajC